jgi:hypothetical protein
MPSARVRQPQRCPGGALHTLNVLGVVLVSQVLLAGAHTAGELRHVVCQFLPQQRCRRGQIRFIHGALFHAAMVSLAACLLRCMIQRIAWEGLTLLMLGQHSRDLC